MADTFTFFRETLPQKIAENPDLLKVGAVYQFDVAGAGTWTLDLVKGEVREEPAPTPGCVIAVAKEHWDQVIDAPMMATQFFMTGQLKASDLTLALQLQRILG
ncbi:MAG: SCP2 sterol-binding domain-containing protein [Deltaproteobacteria bacterium]|nr:SCP2 sterol-binding domain-containing protein [Deltaproteobacteria bacterium]